jgi:two-component system response regulator
VSPARLLLLVEDDANDEELVMLALRSKSEVRLEVARDGPAALEYLCCDGPRNGDSAVLPSAVFLDLNLPRIGGLEVLRRIRAHAHTHLLPVVVLSSSALESDLITSYRSGANSYVVKPIDARQFGEAVQLLADYWLRLNQPLPE